MALLSGHGTTLGFRVSTAFSPGYASIGGYSMTRESIDTSTLATTGTRTMIGGDLFAPGDFTSTYLLDPALQSVTGPEAQHIDTLLFDSGAVAASETVTVTLPVAGSTVAGSAHVTAFELEDLTTDTIIAASITVQWDAAPAWTDAT